MTGVILAQKMPFQNRMSVRNSALALQADLRTAQTYAMDTRDGYRYYGVRFFPLLGGDMLEAGDRRDGWKIVRYEPQNIAPGFNVDAQPVTVIKSSEFVDNTPVPDKTFFERGVTFAAGSELQPLLAAPQNSVVFNERGEATTDGQNFLGAGQDSITLTGFGNNIVITITARTGHIQVPP